MGDEDRRGPGHAAARRPASGRIHHRPRRGMGSEKPVQVRRFSGDAGTDPPIAAPRAILPKRGIRGSARADKGERGCRSLACGEHISPPHLRPAISKSEDLSPKIANHPTGAATTVRVSLGVGQIELSRSAVSPPAEIPDSNRACSVGGNPVNKPGCVGRPSPMPNERATMTPSRCPSPALIRRRTPETATRPNINIARPPNTGGGRTVIQRPTIGNRPSSARMTAMTYPTRLLATPVI